MKAGWDIPTVESILPIGADRNGRLLSAVRPGDKVVEIGGSYNPLISRSADYDAFAIDYAPQEELIERYTREGQPAELVRKIGPVDFICADGNLVEAVGAEHAGTFDVVLSSHNVEHFPNPVRALQAMAGLIKRDGAISLAVPDHRGTFDLFRPLTTIGVWLEAYVTGATRHRLQTFLDTEAYTITLGDQIIWRQNQRLGDLRLPNKGLPFTFDDHVAADGVYRDAHFSVFTPSSFILLIYDLHALGLLDLVPVSLGTDEGWEFYVELRKLHRPPIHPQERLMLLRRIVREQAYVYSRVDPC